MGKWHVLRYGAGIGSDRAPTENPVATDPGPITLLLTRPAERSALIERISIRTLAEVSKLACLLRRREDQFVPGVVVGLSAESCLVVVDIICHISYAI